ncbi:hypothetical protein OSB04_003559 [Centaurea solstitialis]|uniref:Uncharacterized protein n=1 Tax=Centaurea solstitialis TaxID=347529 RepID=A0AA38UCP7_9ASTR|nr:hypothetical protein OSB04_003559 [Centaurea solstitialis]
MDGSVCCRCQRENMLLKALGSYWNLMQTCRGYHMGNGKQWRRCGHSRKTGSPYIFEDHMDRYEDVAKVNLSNQVDSTSSSHPNRETQEKRRKIIEEITEGGKKLRRIGKTVRWSCGVMNVLKSTLLCRLLIDPIIEPMLVAMASNEVTMFDTLSIDAAVVEDPARLAAFRPIGRGRSVGEGRSSLPKSTW